MPFNRSVQKRISIHLSVAIELVQESENDQTTQPTAFHAKDFARKIFGVKAVV